MSDSDVFPPPDTFGPDGSIVKSPYYEYLVNKGAAGTFVALFALTTVCHIIQAGFYRRWWFFPTVVLAAIGELAGWSGRLWSVFAPLNQSPYLLQIVITILAPTPFVGAIFMMFSEVTQKLGEQYSRLSPRMYSRIFLTADIIALIVQGLGGGLAASANSDSGSNTGAKIMLGGIIFQLIALVVFITIATEYYVRFYYDRPVRQTDVMKRVVFGRKMMWFTGAVCCILGFLLIRSVYRTLELADGWNGKIITTQIYFDIFDGLMIFLAMFTLNIFHPDVWMKIPEEEGYAPSQTMQLSGRYPATLPLDSTASTPFASSSKV
ncbi:hypothetical protein EIP91_007852 [Steccherinum ochraceum]|uniref:RTA1-domain-containing protein n=1 Tax=Steccherinum ochraceum TaxID=92696 RepID=A0A4R0R6C8_9APHY|nr:hypothetical protein EIP91_007852 [Steccherinum ochraceum]